MPAEKGAKGRTQAGGGPGMGETCGPRLLPFPKEAEFEGETGKGPHRGEAGLRGPSDKHIRVSGSD